MNRLGFLSSLHLEQAQERIFNSANRSRFEASRLNQLLFRNTHAMLQCAIGFSLRDFFPFSFPKAIRTRLVEISNSEYVNSIKSEKKYEINPKQSQQKKGIAFLRQISLTLY